jgi:hypothetical protein
VNTIPEGRSIARIKRCLAVLAATTSLGASSAWAAPLELNIDPTRTYLNLEGNDASAVRLSDLGIAAGDTITLETFGYFSMYPGDIGTNTNMGAVFSSTNLLLPFQPFVDYWQRIPGAIDAGMPEMVTEAPGFIPWLFDITEDFRVDPSVTVLVPTGAEYLFVAAVDAYFYDNSVPQGGSFGVRISQVPEPAVLSLLGIGLAALGFVRRTKRA